MYYYKSYEMVTQFLKNQIVLFVKILLKILLNILNNVNTFKIILTRWKSCPNTAVLIMKTRYEFCGSTFSSYD